MPYNGSPDEAAHIWHAYSTASGQLLPEMPHKGGAIEMVPGSLPHETCIFAKCESQLAGDPSLVAINSPAGRYNPVYYAVVGWPLTLSPHLPGVLAARLISAALCAALFGWATLVALSLRRRGALAGLVVALTPMAAGLAGAVNPNGIEIAAGAGLSVALIAILLEPDSAGARRCAWWLAGVSGGIMLTVRALGPLWFAMIVAIMLLPLGFAAYRTLARCRRTWWLVGSWVIVGLAGAGWTLWRRTYEIIGYPAEHPVGLGYVVKLDLVREFGTTAKELIGVMGWLDTELPMQVYIAWWMSIGALLILACTFGGAADRWRIGAIGTLGLVVPMALEALQFNTYNFVLQGRYLLPMLVGVPILAGYVLAERIPFDLTPRLTGVFAAVLLTAQVASLCWVMTRYQHGFPTDGSPPSFNPFTGDWLPAVGPALPIAMAVLSAVVFVLYYRRMYASSAAVSATPDASASIAAAQA